MVSLERGLQTHEGAGLGAVAVQHIRLQLPDQALEARPYQKIASDSGSRRMAMR